MIIEPTEYKTAATGITSVSDLQLMTDNLTIIATSGASIGEIGAYLAIEYAAARSFAELATARSFIEYASPKGARA